MKKLLFTTLIGILICTTIISCDKEDDLDPGKTETMPELRWVEGNYTGKFEWSTKIYHGTSTTPAIDKFSVQKCNVKVTLNSDNTLTIIIRGEYNSTLQNKTFSISEDKTQIKCDCYTFDKETQSMRYYERDDKDFNNGQSYQYAYKLFEAYKNI